MSSATPARTCATTSTTRRPPYRHRRHPAHQPDDAPLDGQGGNRCGIHEQRPQRRDRDVLFDIDTTNDRVSLQSAANSGTLAPTGNLGVNAGPNAGFDIYFSHRTRTNHGFAALSVNGAYRFYGINILTGQAVGLGAFPKNHQVTDVALPLNQS